MRKGTVLLIFTRWAPHLEIGRAELGLILVRMIKLFHTVMGPLTEVALRTVLIFSCHMRTDFRLVCSKRPSSVLVEVMIEWTALKVMILWILLARVYFESEQVEKHDALVHTNLACIEASAMRTAALVRNQRLLGCRSGIRPVARLRL